MELDNIDIELGNGIDSVLFANATTIGSFPPKDYTLGKWKQLLLSEHSTLEFADFTMYGLFDGRMVSHLVRHTKGHPRHAVYSHREDWTKKDRPDPSTKRMYLSKWTPYSWIQMCRQRLCYKAASYTRDAIVNARNSMKASKEPFFMGLAWASVPDCIYRNGCPYSTPCGWWASNQAYFSNKSVKERYDAYNNMEG